MKASKLIVSRFEHYLQNDPLFVEYFNAFLFSPAFSKKLQYDNDSHMMLDRTQMRLWTKATTNKESRQGNLKRVDRTIESRTLMKWSRQNRLPFFLKSKSYLEYKLCKYLLHERDSRRATEMPFSALDCKGSDPNQLVCSPSGPPENRPKSTSDVSLKSWPLVRDEFTAIHSRATSVPNMSLAMGSRTKSAGPVYFEDGAELHKNCLQRPSTCGVSNVYVRSQQIDELSPDFSELCLEENEEKMSVLEFTDVDTTHTNNELKDISMKRQLTFQELKMNSIGSVSGMEDFKEFLKKTTGQHLLKFWLDAEHYSDHAVHLQNAPDKRRESGIRLFRIMQDRYKHQLTEDAKEEIKSVLQNEGYSEHLFIRAQADILRRLKFYWLPRFLVHLERQNNSMEDSSKLSSRLASSMSFFPSLCVVRSLPTLGHILSEEARERSFASLYEFRGHSRIKSGMMKRDTLKFDEDRSEKDPLISALNEEKDSGYPFLTYLESVGAENLTNSLHFWLDVDEFLKQDERYEDRLNRVYTAWNIFNRYISEANGVVLANKRVTEEIRSHLVSAREITKETALELFADLKLEAAERIRKAWNDFQEHEIEKLEKASRNPSPITTSHQTKRVMVEDDYEYSPSRWVKRNPGSSDSERRVRLQTALSMAEDCNMSRMSSQILQAEKTESVKKKKKKRKKHVRSEEQESGEEWGNAAEKKEEKPRIEDLISNKEAMAAFKQFLQNEEGRDSINSLSMCLDIEAFLEIHPAKKLSRQQLSSTIYRVYFDPSSRRAVGLPDDIIDKVEDETPSTPTLLEAKYSVFPDLEASFETFYKKMQYALQREMNAVATAGTNRNSSAGNKPDTMESFRSFHSHLNAPKTGKKKRKGTGKSVPTKEDRVSFIEEVQASSGRMSSDMELFRKYLIVKEEPGAFPRLEKDLLFYIEVQKFKDLYPFLDEVALNRKVEVIIDVFLDSATPPWLQVDLNQEQAGKAIQKAQQYYSMTKRVPREQKDPFIFDDAQTVILKEILPYWAGYCKQYRDSDTTPEFPMTKQEKEHRKRQKEITKLTLAHQRRPNRPKTPGFGESKHELTFTIGRGFKWKEAKIDVESVLSESSASGSRKSSYLTVS